MAKDKRQFLQTEPPKWKHLPTESARFPQIMLTKMRAIARWADKQENPLEALDSVLEFINGN